MTLYETCPICSGFGTITLNGEEIACVECDGVGEIEDEESEFGDDAG